MKFPNGVTYLAIPDYPAKFPPVFRVTVAPGSFNGEMFDVRVDAWVDSVEMNKLMVNMSDEDFVEITPRLAEEIIAKKRKAHGLPDS